MALPEKRAPRKKIRLTSRDINIVSVIAQKKDMPHDYLLTIAKDAGVSSQAFLVIKAVLKSSAAASKSKVSKKAGVKRVSGHKKVVTKKLHGKKTPAASKSSSATAAANDFSSWVAAIK